MIRARKMLALVCVLMLAMPAATQMHEPLDLEAVQKMKDEGLNRSQVMDIISWLTDVHGPRLTGSPQIRAAGEWAIGKMKEWGLANPRFESWGPFGRGWSNERFYAQVIAPVPFPVLGYSMAWTPGTNGLVTADVVPVTVTTAEDFAKYKGQLRGKIVLLGPPRIVNPAWDPIARRYSDEQLEGLSQQPFPAVRQPGKAAPQFGGGQAFVRQRTQFLVDEGVVATLEPGAGRGDGGSVVVGRGGSQAVDAPPTVTRISIASEHFGRLYRILDKKIPVKMELNVENKFYDQDLNGFNVVAEIPGTDKADELVMLGAHFDSWHSGTGATDNAAGSAVMLEAVRILKASGLKMRRTVRIGLWGGEEQGLIGSREHVAANFGAAVQGKWDLKPAHAKFSGYFNIDNGTGKIRGVYLQGNEAIAPVFKRWMEPFANMGMTTLSIRNTGGTDHLSFDRAGLPGFQFIQDQVEYGTRTHHSNMDQYDRIQPNDMRQMAIILAAFVYHAANRDQLLPRKPMPPAPAPRGPRGGGPPGEP